MKNKKCVFLASKINYINTVATMLKITSFGWFFGSFHALGHLAACHVTTQVVYFKGMVYSERITGEENLK